MCPVLAHLPLYLRSRKFCEKRKCRSKDLDTDVYRGTNKLSMVYRYSGTLHISKKDWFAWQ